PWLKLDGDPYPAVIDGRIKWIVDGYTTLNNYPYSRLTEFGTATQDSLVGVERQPNQEINYIRNSAKATVDAYDGTVTLYAVDEEDPVLTAWRGVFPDLVKPSSAFPPVRRGPFRYPEGLLMVERKLRTEYHVADPGDFFADRAFWEVPPDQTAAQCTERSPQPPYYVIAQIPGQDQP